MQNESNNMITDWQKKVNEEFFTNMQSYLKEGGTWIWPSAGFTYTVTNGKFLGESEEADLALKAILPDINNIQ